MNQARLAKKQQQRVEQARLAKKTKETFLEKKRLKVFVCKRCFAKYSSNIKFYEHIRNHYTKNFDKLNFDFELDLNDSRLETQVTNLNVSKFSKL